MFFTEKIDGSLKFQVDIIGRLCQLYAFFQNVVSYFDM